MNIQVNSYLGRDEDGETVLIPVNSKGCEDIEIDLSDINVLSDNKALRLISFGRKNHMYKLTLKSYKALKKIFNRK